MANVPAPMVSFHLMGLPIELRYMVYETILDEVGAPVVGVLPRPHARGEYLPVKVTTPLRVEFCLH